MLIIMGFYTASQCQFHDRGYSDILYGINSYDIMQESCMECCTPEHSVTTITWQSSRYTTTYDNG